MIVTEEKLKGNHTMTLQILGIMDGRQRGRIVRNEKGQFTTIAGRNEVLQKEIDGYFKNINRLKPYLDQNSDLKIFIEQEQAKVDAAQSEMRLNNMSRRGINERVKNYRMAMEQQGLSGQALEEQVTKYKEGLLTERKNHFNKLKGKALATHKGNLKVKPEPQKQGFWGKVGNFFKKNKKIAIGTGVITAGVGVYLALKGDNKEVPNAPKIEASQESIQIDTTDVKQSASQSEKSVTSETSNVSTELESTDVHIVQSGESYWKIAKQNLIDKYKDVQKSKGEAIDLNYKPSNAEVLEETKRLMAKNKAKFDDEQWNTVPPIHPNDSLDISA